MKLLKRGKVKDLYEIDENELEFYFTDRISVFDKVIPVDVPRKGETLCGEATFWFEKAEEIGIRTHFLRLSSPNRMRAKRVDIIADYDKLNENTTNYLIPIEWISRHYVAGSLHDRLREGKVDPVDLGFPEGATPSYGDELPQTLLEQTTKLEKVDRKIDKSEVLQISGLTEDEYDEICELTIELDERISNEVGQRSLLHVDGKKEFAFDENRKIMVVDSFGTCDEDRFWDTNAYQRGEFHELSKETVRQYYRSTSYFDVLEEARRDGQEEPEIPPLPPEKLAEVSNLYMEMYERITGQPFKSE
ncbi:MAG: phosphoribosylaminoimidazolesuccinocarboxamide synthase [Methanobacteriota archaeon]|nr:MAG: phosphoribosylaminoimidazolesuccinocarboxamide synthase [Euryarchaeota archaeon]